MKRKTLKCILGLSLCASMLLSACGSKETESAGEETVADTSEDTPATSATEDNGGETSEDNSGNRESVVEEPEELSYFGAAAADADRMVAEALEQVNAGDYTPLDEPVKYNVLWLGFTHVTYDDLDFQMTDFDREYLEAVTLNYEKSVESITNHNIDISVELHFVDDATPLTQASGADWLYLDQKTVQPIIDSYTAGKEFDTVLTTVQTAGEENVSRNEDKDGYGINYVMLGLKTAGIENGMGYSTFDLQKPVEGTYPLEDPEIPSLYATAVSVHEWMHQLEYLGTIMGIPYPPTHAYQGETPGYEEFIANENDYDYFEFYKLVLTGKLPYTGGSGTQYVGMYPKMWPLIKNGVFNMGSYTIKAADGSGYLCGNEEDPTLTLGSDPCVWNIRYSSEERFVLSPVELPDKLVDLGNAWDLEGNTIGLWIYTGYADAQSWHLVGNKDGSYSIQTPYESGMLLTAQKGVQTTLCTAGADGVQNWIIEPVK